MRIIDADSLKERFNDVEYAVVDDVIDAEPTLDAELIVHSYWIPNEFEPGYVTCAQCGEGHSNGNFCEICGARMDIDNPADVE